MYRLLPALLLSLLLVPAAHSQTPDDWAQHVQYEMDITLKADQHEMLGTQRLVYTNNSPDTLHTVYYHLYFNAFQPTSMMAERNRQLPDPDDRVVPRIFNLGPEEIGYHRVQSLTQDGTPVSYELTDTVLRVDLAHPIPPNSSTTFRMRFRSQVPLQTRRSGRDNLEGIDFSMSQWYPKMAAYDERGWHPDPYVGREFYAPFGTFDVQITLPAHYTIGATGVLQNPGDIGHGYGLEGTGLYRPGDGNDAPSDSLTWHFRAENVHDFAWAADPDYLHERVELGDGQIYHLLYEADVEDRWQPMDQWVPRIIRFYSQRFGPYAYPQFTVAQAGDGGMEYPMINFITGERSPGSLLGVTAHEAAHEWFYAVLASNEADYAWMDEGFTSYATTEAVAHIRGITNPPHTGNYLSVLSAQDAGVYERMSTPADWFTTNLAYGVASYPGGEMLVDMLGYVISEPLRDLWLKTYYRASKFEHPDPFELEKWAEDVSGLRLDWYFEQYTNTTRELDYAVDDVEQQRNAEGGWTAAVTLRRNDELVMPIDVRFTLADGSTQWVNIPLGIMQGHKPVPDSWIVAEPWLWTFPEYTLAVDLPARATAVEIDPRGMMPDRNRLNNRDDVPTRTRFLRPPEPSWFAMGVGVRPLAQYAHDFGVGVGVQARGMYPFGGRRFEAMLKLWPQVLFSGGDAPDLPARFNFASETLEPSATSFFDGIDYTLTMAHDVELLGPQATLELSAQKHLGLMQNTLTVEKPVDAPITAFTDGPEHAITAQLVHQWNPTDRIFGATDFEQNGRSPAAATTRINPFAQEHMVSAKVEYRAEAERDWLIAGLELGGSIKDFGNPFDGTTPDDQSATRFYLSAGQGYTLGPFEGRATLQFGLGDDNLAGYKRFRLGGVPLERQWQNAAFRSTAAAFADPVADAHLVGIGPSGPVAYLRSLPFNVAAGPAGTRLLEGRLSLFTPRFQGTGLLQPLRLGVFSGIGQTWSRGDFLAGFDADNLLADAGLAVDYDLAAVNALDRWIAQSDVLSQLQLTARFPLWASDPTLTQVEDNEFGFRWLLGVKIGL